MPAGGVPSGNWKRREKTTAARNAMARCSYMNNLSPEVLTVQNRFSGAEFWKTGSSENEYSIENTK
jgi:hypothetical protein